MRTKKENRDENEYRNRYPWGCEKKSRRLTNEKTGDANKYN